MNKPHFLNLRVKSEMTILKRLIWRVFGKKVFGIDEETGWKVTAYEYKNITLIWGIEE